MVAAVPGAAPREQLAISVHGAAGVLDLVVPSMLTARALAEEYAALTGASTIPLLFTTTGTLVRPDRTLDQIGVEPGTVLVATDAGPSAAVSLPTDLGPTGPQHAPVWSMLWPALAVTAGVLAAALAVASSAGDTREATAGVLLAAALLSVLPVGSHVRRRAAAAPAFAAGAVVIVSWAWAEESLPLVLGLGGLAAAVTAAVASALGGAEDEGLRVWIAAGGGLFVLAGGSALLGLPESWVWSLAAVLAMLATRVVPAYAVDVPDQLRVDLERLAVTAWSARDRPTGRRGRTVVPASTVAEVAARGARTVVAASVAVAVVAVGSSALLVFRVDLDLDRWGAWVLVWCVGGALLLAARSYRLPLARAALRVGGLGSWAALLVVLLASASPRTLVVVAAASVTAAALLVLVAVATGRGWRSAWWARQAELAEAICGAVAVAMVLVSTGIVRELWELGSTMFSGGVTG